MRRDLATVDGVLCPYLHAGPVAAAEAVVLLHGNPGPAADWRGLGGRVARFARAVAPDLPGWGGAGEPVGFGHTVDAYAAHLERLLLVLGVERVHLVLHDLGGPWGLTWAAAHRERLASLTLVDVGVLRGYRWHLLARIWRTPLLGEAFLRGAPPELARRVLARGNPRGLPTEVADRMLRDFQDPRLRRALLRAYRATDVASVSEDLHEQLHGVAVPVLVVWGAHDPYLPVEHAARQRETFPEAEVVVLDSSGHWPMHDDPQTFERIVERFLRRAVGAEASEAG